MSVTTESSAATETTLMARLRNETHAEHSRAESSPLERALVNGDVTAALYTDYLTQRLFIHTRLERGMRRLNAADPRFAHFLSDDLYQEANLRRDLAALSAPIPATTNRRATLHLIELLEQLDTDRSVALFGVYYVFEGSKNGARYIARAIAKTLGLAPAPGLLYLDPHGAEQRARWQAFRAAVDAQNWTPAESDAIVAAAKATFDAISAIDDELWESRATPAVAAPVLAAR